MRRHWSMSRHATARAVEMQLDAEEILRAVDRPDEVYSSVKYPGRVLHRAGRISVALSADLTRVVTILWANQSEWDKAYARGIETGRPRRARFNEVVAA